MVTYFFVPSTPDRTLDVRPTSGKHKFFMYILCRSVDHFIDLVLLDMTLKPRLKKIDSVGSYVCSNVLVDKLKCVRHRFPPKAFSESDALHALVRHHICPHLCND